MAELNYLLFISSLKTGFLPPQKALCTLSNNTPLAYSCRSSHLLPTRPWWSLVRFFLLSFSVHTSSHPISHYCTLKVCSTVVQNLYLAGACGYGLLCRKCSGTQIVRSLSLSHLWLNVSFPHASPNPYLDYPPILSSMFMIITVIIHRYIFFLNTGSASIC